MNNKKEILYDGLYYDVTEWVKRHPGGSVIELYVSNGEDSTMAVQQFHHRSVNKVKSIMKSLPRREPNEEDEKASNLDLETKTRNKALTKDFVDLYEALKQNGYFEQDLIHCCIVTLEFIALCYLGVFLLRLNPPNLVFKMGGISAVGLGFCRSAYTMHEAIHLGFTGKPKFDRVIRSLYNGLFLGISGACYTAKHSKHHAMPQHFKNDQDLQGVPLVAFHKDTVKDQKDGKGFFIQNQKWLFAPLDSFIIILAWKLYTHPRYCYYKGIYDDLLYIVLHYIVFIGSIGFVNYMLAVWLASVMLIVNFSLSHSHLPVAKEPTHWVEYGLMHTANVRSSWFSWVDYWMGNLNYQIEHHLFPTMPQHKMKLCRDKVKALAKKHNLPYHLYTYTEALRKSFDNLGIVSKELAAD